MQPTVFFSRCKPRRTNAVELAVRNKRVFIGYPFFRPGAVYDPRGLRSCVVDLRCGDDEWAAAEPGAEENLSQYRANRNLAREIDEGAIAIIPDGEVYHCGVVCGPLELVDSPPWYEEFLALRRADNGLKGEDNDLTREASEVAQCWTVNEFITIPVTLIPSWIRSSLGAQRTWGRVNAKGHDPYNEMLALMSLVPRAPRDWTTDLNEIANRLRTDMTPSNLEHLVVDLLQLEHPEEIWRQVGGAGDGGIDGVGLTPRGDVIGVLQSKWRYRGEPVFLQRRFKLGSSDVRARQYLSSLDHDPEIAPGEGIEFLGAPEIAALVLKHAKRLPRAQALRAGVKTGM